jgi:DNA-binding SARP family transcriptional activator
MLAAHVTDEAIRAAECSVKADPTAEPAYRLLDRAHLAHDDASGARRALEQFRQVLAELGVPIDTATPALLDSLRRPG